MLHQTKQERFLVFLRELGNIYKLKYMWIKKVVLGVSEHHFCIRISLAEILFSEYNIFVNMCSKTELLGIR